MIALLIIDMQKGMFTVSRFDLQNVIGNINMIAQRIRKLNGKVIFIQHEGNKEEGYVPNTEEWELIPEISRDKNDVILRKTACDSFYKTDLEGVLRKNRVKQIIITGCATDYCVDTTIKAATSREYYVFVPKDGHTTADRPSMTAKQVIDHYNWIWSNLILPGKNMQVLPTRELLHEIENVEK
jgi:nicotinamidase-related amidase